MDLALRDRAEALLNRAGHAYGVHVGRDDVHRALADAERGTAFAEWANMHLGSDHLLTVDELALYSALDKSGRVDKLADVRDLGVVQAVNEDEVRAAIEQLSRSTADISKQTEILRQQQDALLRLAKKTGEAETQRRDLELARQRKLDSERKTITTEVDALSLNLSLRASDLDQQSKETKGGLDRTAESAFRSDDELLSSLRKLGWEVDQGDPGEDQTAKKARDICMRLIKITVETLRTRLDKVYIETILATERLSQTRPANEQEVKALEEELESLYSEILPVAQMSTEQEHLEPALKSTSSRNYHSLRHSAAAVTYVDGCLDYLLDRMDCLSNLVGTLKSHQAATASLVLTAKTEISSSVPVDRGSAQQAHPCSSVRPLSPIRLKAPTSATKPRSGGRRSSGIYEEPAMEALLRNLALSLSSSEDDSSEGQISEIAKVLPERSAKADDVFKNSQESFEVAVNSRVQDALLAIQMLRDSVLAESPFGKVKMVDPEIEGSIDFLSQEVRKVRERLGTVDGKGSRRSEKKSELLQRWCVQ